MTYSKETILLLQTHMNLKANYSFQTGHVANMRDGTPIYRFINTSLIDGLVDSGFIEQIYPKDMAISVDDAAVSFCYYIPTQLAIDMLNWYKL